MFKEDDTRNYYPILYSYPQVSEYIARSEPSLLPSSRYMNDGKHQYFSFSYIETFCGSHCEAQRTACAEVFLPQIYTVNRYGGELSTNN
jgi:hypothetical protein